NLPYRSNPLMPEDLVDPPASVMVLHVYFSRYTSASGSAKWQAVGWPTLRSVSTGSSLMHFCWSVADSAVANFGHRVRNRQPLGGFTGLGTSPVRTTRWRVRSFCGSGSGIAEISAWV